jgi:solute carrier family 35 protein F1/2
MCGLFGAIISGAQVIIFELQLLLSTVYTPVILGLVRSFLSPVALYFPKVSIFLALLTLCCAALQAFMYIACLWLMYSATSSFLKAGDATMFNLSLLTSDFYGFLFAVLIEHHKLSILYGVGFSVIIW